jgi:NADPH2:quinone reductase
MKRLRFDRFGAPSVLRVEDVDDQCLINGEALVEVHAASINPSDLGNVAGRFPRTTLPGHQGGIMPLS